MTDADLREVLKDTYDSRPSEAQWAERIALAKEIISKFKDIINYNIKLVRKYEIDILVPLTYQQDIVLMEQIYNSMKNRHPSKIIKRAQLPLKVKYGKTLMTVHHSLYLRQI